ncbi:MAG: EamA family transporter [Lentisphaeria bacterium]|nr:EamA family transporter [Lentisphaeria bacterium]
MSQVILCSGIMFGSAFLSAVSQILLKSSTRDEHPTMLSRYLNGKVITAYAIFFATLFMNIYAFSVVPFKYGSVIMASSYTFTLILAALLLKERPTWRSICGNLMILAGIAVYASNLF